MRRLLPLAIGVLFLVGPSPAADLHPSLETHLQSLGSEDWVSVILILRDQAPVASIDAALKTERATRQERHERVVTALQEASASQADLLAALSTGQARGEVDGFTSYWIANLVVARITKAAVLALTTRDDIEVIERNPRPALVEPVAREAVDGEGRGIGVTPGLRAINADQVWYELGITGAGRLVGGCDTGVDGTHPALADRWRGNWHPAEECWLNLYGDPTDFPTDEDGHGTHTMGTMTGLGAATEDTVGVAWNAQWIATDPIEQYVSPAFDNDIFTAFQWFADPDGDPATIDDVPDVVQNSWGINEGFPGDYVDCDTRWWQVIDNLEASGVVACWSAGNEGPDYETIGSPADRITTATNTFSVGAVDATNYSFPYPIANFSSRGPSGCDGVTIKPEVVAPGVQVYSSLPGGGYGNNDGTSMAGPHVAGVVALMREANPDLAVDTIKQIIMQTCVDLGRPGEDNIYGWGIIDAYAAVSAVLSGFGTVSGTVTNASNGDTPVIGVMVEAEEAECRVPSGPGGAYAVSLPVGTYTLTTHHPSFVSQSVSDVQVAEDQTTTLSFSLIDVGGPGFSETTDWRSTEDTAGPYMVQSVVSDYSALADVTLHYRIDGGDWVEVPMTARSEALYEASIPGQPQVTHIEYYLSATDIASNGGSTDIYEFWIAPATVYLEDDMEGGAPDWTHEAGSGFGDQWHLSTQRNHTSGGTTSWKCGDTGDEEYAPLLDASLITRTLALDPDSYLHYWQWIDAQESSNTPEVALDGGRIEIRIVGEAWEPLTPDGGYTHWIRETDGPFADLTRVFSGSADWHEVAVDLGDYAGEAELRFRFGSNGSMAGEGWYIDDVLIDGFAITLSAVDERAVSTGLRLSLRDPNPFVDRTRLGYRLPAAAEVQLALFDPAGRMVRLLVSATQAAGSYEVIWDGLDRGRRPVPSGVYLARLKVGGDAVTRRVIRAR